MSLLLMPNQPIVLLSLDEIRMDCQGSQVESGIVSVEGAVENLRLHFYQPIGRMVYSTR